MKVDAASIAFSSQYSATVSSEQSVSLHAWSGPSRPAFEGGAAASPAPAISPAAYSAQTQELSSSSSGAQAINDAFDKANNDPIVTLIRSLLEMLTGHSVRIFSLAAQPAQAAPSAPTPNPSPSPAPQPSPVRQSAGFGIELDSHQSRTETERSAFQAEGTVRTADGQEIKFQLDLTMQRSYSEQSSLSLSAGDARKKDPLVINFGGSAAQLQSRRFKFDLEGNGQTVNMPMLASNSGYLALDLNGNGKIDSGKELFGTASGNGFADLAGYDSDGNGWIDERDPVFKQLRVWTPGSQGAGDASLNSLQDKGIGALYLGSQKTSFEIRDAANQSLGAVRASGIYLGENGSAGTLQQIDLSV